MTPKSLISLEGHSYNAFLNTEYMHVSRSPSVMSRMLKCHHYRLKHLNET